VQVRIFESEQQSEGELELAELALPVEEMAPKPGSPKPESGAAKLGVLVRLNDSARNCSWTRSFSGIWRKSEDLGVSAEAHRGL